MMMMTTWMTMLCQTGTSVSFFSTEVVDVTVMDTHSAVSANKGSQDPIRLLDILKD